MPIGMRATSSFWGLAVVGAIGCAKSPPASRFPNAADALGRMRATYACANGIQGLGKLDHFGDRGRIRGDASVIAVNPARLRIDISSPFGATPYTLTSDGRTFALNDLPNKQFFRGPASACNLARLTQVPVPGHALVYLLRGEAPLLRHEPTAPRLEWESGHYRIDVPSERDAKQTLLVEVYDEDYALDWSKQRMRVVGLSIEQGGALLYRATMSNFARSKTANPRVDDEGLEPPLPPSGGPCELDVPRSIRIEVPSSGDDVLFQYREMALNPPLPERTFSQPLPSGSTPLDVTCD